MFLKGGDSSGQVLDGLCDRQDHWGAAGLEPLTGLVTDVLAGACVLRERNCLLGSEGDGGRQSLV